MSDSVTHRVVFPTAASVGRLLRLLMAHGVPDEATMAVHVDPGDRPFDSGTETWAFEWQVRA